MLLSIVVPFYNAEQNSARLLQTLGRLVADDIEIICVDDGSTDGTPLVLERFAAKARIPVNVLRQSNGGPGRARNAGLSAAAGQYVWFVDCDDDIDLEAVEYLRTVKDQGFDVIDFNFVMPGGDSISTVSLGPGRHAVVGDVRLELLRNYGAICTKFTSRRLLVENSIRYPEFTFYEDNPLGSLIPFHIQTLLKVEEGWYLHYVDYESITRQALSPRYFDRLQTALLGLRWARRLTSVPGELTVVENRFIDLFFVNTANQIFGMSYPNTGFLGSLRHGRIFRAGRQLFDHVASFWFARSTIHVARVARYLREVAPEMTWRDHIRDRVRAVPSRSRVPWRTVWILSYLFPPQRARYERAHADAWAASRRASGVLAG